MCACTVLVKWVKTIKRSTIHCPLYAPFHMPTTYFLTFIYLFQMNNWGAFNTRIKSFSFHFVSIWFFPLHIKNFSFSLFVIALIYVLLDFVNVVCSICPNVFDPSTLGVLSEPWIFHVLINLYLIYFVFKKNHPSVCHSKDVWTFWLKVWKDEKKTSLFFVN